MKQVTASEARRNWFRLLDEVVAGATVVIERGGRRIVIQREAEAQTREEIPDYGSLISIPSAEEADEWSWEWEAPESDLTVVDRERSEKPPPPSRRRPPSADEGRE